MLINMIICAGFVLSACTNDTNTDISEEKTEDTANNEDKHINDTEDKNKEKTKSYENVTPTEAQKLIEENGDLLIVDVSPKYDEGHLLNSVNYYVGDGSLDEAVFSLNKERTYLVYCHIDSAAIAGAEKLIEAGMENVYRLEGNYSGWVEAGYSVITNIVGDSNSLNGNLDDVTSGNSEGIGYILRKNKLNHKVTANLPDLEKEKFYEGWLVNKSKGSDFFSTGKMIKTPEGKWILEYVEDNLQEGYDYAVITLEIEDDGQPEEHIIEGNIK